MVLCSSLIHLYIIFQLSHCWIVSRNFPSESEMTSLNFLISLWSRLCRWNVSLVGTRQKKQRKQSSVVFALVDEDFRSFICSVSNNNTHTTLSIRKLETVCGSLQSHLTISHWQTLPNSTTQTTLSIRKLETVCGSLQSHFTISHWQTLPNSTTQTTSSQGTYIALLLSMAASIYKQKKCCNSCLF